MSMSGIIVFLECDPFGSGTCFFKRACDLGLRPILLSTKPERYQSLAKFENLRLLKMTDSAVIDAINRLGRDRVRGVWSLRNSLVGLAARVSMAIGRQGADPECIEICCDKVQSPANPSRGRRARPWRR